MPLSHHAYMDGIPEMLREHLRTARMYEPARSSIQLVMRDDCGDPYRACRYW